MPLEGTPSECHHAPKCYFNTETIHKKEKWKRFRTDCHIIPPWHQCQTCLIICISINYEGEIWNLLFHLVDLQSCTKAVICCILLKSLDMKDRLLSLQLMPQLLWWVNTEYSGIATPTWKDHKLELTVHKAIKQGLPPSLFRDLQRYRQNRDNIQQLNNPEASRKSHYFSAKQTVVSCINFTKYGKMFTHFNLPYWSTVLFVMLLLFFFKKKQLYIKYWYSTEWHSLKKGFISVTLK